jgi:hypothetical protein
MLPIAAIIVLAATTFVDSSDSDFFASSDASEIEALLEGYMESDEQGEEIVFDDSLLIDADAEMQEFEE